MSGQEAAAELARRASRAQQAINELGLDQSTQVDPRPEGYGRYKDDPEHIGCPRARSDMTPCVARDGQLAVADSGVCVGCGEKPANLLMTLVFVVTTPVQP